MNSEVPPIPESDRHQSLQSEDNTPEVKDVEATAEATSANSTNIPLKIDSEAVSESIAETIDQESESEIQSESWLDKALEATESLELKTSETTASDLESSPEPELFADRWLDEPETVNVVDNIEQKTEDISALESQKAKIKAEIAELQTQKAQIILQQTQETQANVGRMIEEGLRELKDRKNVLQIEIEKLERRQERIRQEMRTNFAGASQELAVRVQGFKNYLVGSLQDLASAAEKLDLSGEQTRQPPRARERNLDRDTDRIRERDRGRGRTLAKDSRNNAPSAQPQFSEQAFVEQTRKIRQLIDRYRHRPDYYGSPWQLRRTFEPIHAEKVQEWFFTQGGRGAIDSLASRLQNILIASAIISIVHNLYGDRCRVLVLIDTPEKLGEWRRGLQDCLGISRSDFGSDRGVVLFDSAEVLVQRAERLVKDKLLPLIIIDETDELVNLSLLKFPLWLAFASANQPSSSNYLY